MGWQSIPGGSTSIWTQSAPKIFSAAADALLWCMAKEGVREAIHYLDDYMYLFVGRDDCSAALAIATTTCERLGIPIAQDKLEGPTTTLSFLGLQFDTVAGDLRLPEENCVGYVKNSQTG